MIRLPQDFNPKGFRYRSPSLPSSFLQFSRPVRQQGNRSGLGTITGEHGETLAAGADVIQRQGAAGKVEKAS